MPNQDQAAPFAVDRRHLLPALAHELVAWLDLARGRPVFQLGDLWTMPDQQLAQIIPRQNPAVEVFVADGYLWSREARSGAVHQEFATEWANIVTFNLFDGQRSLDNIGRRVAEEMGWEESQGFAHAKSLFLTLVRHLVCVPANGGPNRGHYADHSP